METEQVRVRHILLKHTGSRNPYDRYRKKDVTRSLADAEAGIRDARAAISNEDDFATTAERISECGSAQVGGDLGFFTHGEMQKAFEDAAFALKVGEMSNLVSTDSGIHIIWRVA